MTVRRRLAPIILAAVVCAGIGYGLAVNVNTTPDIAVVDVQLPTLSIEGN